MAVTKAMTLAEMRTFVRSALDTDATDVPNDLLDRWLIDGSDRIEAFADSWKFRQVDYSFSVVAGTQSYKLRNPSRNAGFTYDIARIEDVRGPNWSLRPVSHQAIRQDYRLSTTSSGTPRYYSVWGDSLYLWPSPSSSATYTLSGYREPIDWVGTAVAPDFPDEFHELVAWWGLSLGHAREGDPGMASYYSDLFNEQLRRRASSFTGGGEEQPFVMNGGGSTRRSRSKRMLYDYE